MPTICQIASAVVIPTATPAIERPAITEVGVDASIIIA